MVALLTLSALPRAVNGALVTAVEQSQAEAAQRMIVLAVEQGIATLPPTSGQSFAYQFDPQRDTFVRSEQMGPIVLRSPQTLGDGVTDLRFGVSYFHLDQSFSPINYKAVGGPVAEYTRFGLNASADVTLLNFSAGHGFTSWLEARLNLPVVIVDAHAETVDLVFKSNPTTVGFTLDPKSLNSAICSGRHDTDCSLVYKKESLGSLDGTSFSHGTNVGLGRTSVGVKVLASKRAGFQLAFEPELFFPSPNQDQFAGSDTFAIMPRLVGGYTRGWLRVYGDIGYDYDFDVAELRRFAWDIGASTALSRAVLDLGVGGSQYVQAVEWTPNSAPIPNPTGKPFGMFVKLPGANNELGTTFVNLLLGAKFKLTDSWLIGAAVAIPLDQSPFRPDALGTLAIEAMF